MNNNKQKTSSVSKKARFSITFKINTRLVLQLLGIFLCLDIFICLAMATGMVISAEKTTSQAVDMLYTSGLPQGNTLSWLNIAGYSILPHTVVPGGFKIPEIFQGVFPESTANGTRNLDLPKNEYASFLKRLDGLNYSIAFMLDGAVYEVSVALGPTIMICKYALLALLFIEFFMLINSIVSGARIIRDTLRPIAELAETARNLNKVSASFAPNMEALAGKIDGIDAARLDTRISLEGTQDELLNLAQAINCMLDRINDSYRSQIRFVSDASHELRTPISVIQGYANLLDRWGKNDEKALQESIDAIKDETANMKGLVEQLLFLARGDNNSMTLQMERFALSALADEVLRETQMIDGAHEYESHITPVFIFADEALIKQALRILVDNAIKYTGKGGHIVISVLQEGEFAKLIVQDDGIGIPAEAVPQIFDRFYRADESRARSTGGTGLGLSIANWITQRHAGHLEVLSREDIGTRISIAIPIA